MSGVSKAAPAFISLSVHARNVVSPKDRGRRDKGGYDNNHVGASGCRVGYGCGVSWVFFFPSLSCVIGARTCQDNGRGRRDKGEYDNGQVEVESARERAIECGPTRLIQDAA